ncbi:MAG: class I SAM-dependent methyltransferase [Saprospiraceae bacterium]|nr:class I SAM-dependent methyltransferase [Saprospiraceae bacterium]
MMKNKIAPLVLLAFLALVSCQSTDHNHHQDDPDGIAAGELDQSTENHDRDSWQEPNRVIDQLGTLTGKTVADIGAGTGYFTFRLLPKAEKVIAIEIDDRFIQYLDNQVTKLPDSLANRLETRLAEPGDPHLQNEEVDVILVVNTYIYMSDRIRYFRDLKLSFKPGGHLVIVDFKKKPMKVGPSQDLRMAAHQIEAELLSAGYTNIRVDNTTLEYQYMIRAEL